MLFSTMSPHRKRLSAVAAFAAIHLAVSPSEASEMQSSLVSENLQTIPFEDFFSDNSFSNFDRMLQRAMSSLTGLVGPMEGISPFGSSSIIVTLDNRDEKG